MEERERKCKNQSLPRYISNTITPLKMLKTEALHCFLNEARPETTNVYVANIATLKIDVSEKVMNE